MKTLLKNIRACRVCVAHLPHGPRPVIRAHADARVLIIGQAPGTRVHQTGIPWDDPSGERLRTWMNVDRNYFYDERRFAIVPMGFCYPGKGRSGDLPPRPECAPLWHPPILAEMPKIDLTLLIGRYAQRHYLPQKKSATLTDTVRRWREFGPQFLPLPHPSPRNRLWLSRNPWFESEVVPALRDKLRRIFPD